MPRAVRQTVFAAAGPVGLVGLVVALAAAGCRFDADYGDSALRCSAAAPACPPGFACVGDVCRRGADGPPGDAGPDASVCELAAAAADNDGCGAAIDLTPAALAAGGATVHGDTTGYTNDLTPSTLPGCTGAPEPGPDALYRLTLAAGDTVHLTLAPEGWTGAVYLIDACTGTAACEGGAAAFTAATIPITAAGTYYVVVDAPTAGAAGCFTLAARIAR